MNTNFRFFNADVNRKIISNFFLQLTTLAAVALADPYYYGYYGHQLQWPGVRAPGFSSTCWGCRGKKNRKLVSDSNSRYIFGFTF